MKNTMDRSHDAVLTFGVVLACAAAVAAAIGLLGLPLLIGFILGMLATLVAAAIAGKDFE